MPRKGVSGDKRVEVAGDHVPVEWCVSVGSYEGKQDGAMHGLVVWISGWGLWLAVLMGLEGGEDTQGARVGATDREGEQYF